MTVERGAVRPLGFYQLPVRSLFHRGMILNFGIIVKRTACNGPIQKYGTG